MTQLAMDLPENVFSALRMAPREFANEMRIAAAVQWYGEQRVLKVRPQRSPVSAESRLLMSCAAAMFQPSRST